MCWLGILAALLAVPLVAHDRRWLLDSVHDTAAAAAHGSDLFLHFCLGLGAIIALLVLCLLFLRHLLRLLKSAARERPFTHANAQRLQHMAWLMLAMELLSILIGAYAAWMGPDFTWMEVGGGMSITGLVAVLMLFVLARVFAVGAAMRDDLDGVI
ncbi:DUF2975 domain-containing protein [Stenotrophomonas maltophilia]|uniref:DUF2975 domain-containing protein n=2 Tax=Gammaproteobacteria TaxID=1236 RepID=UPI00201CC303|nr:MULTISPECIES: DUF2975 domain-containing protein [Stenotrophomonas]MBN5027076.1 DUF2975 domain-containing protein [Stenotrophomonas maltophilia]MDH1273350.1 DUF2975 domain-containing protein [Stenotrophomonas sp. GD03937]MDH1485736.1 DUF2975 domain-containing protein [Stenotrophomonas sp. GD03712]MDR2958649.1 DUF2975 domain-containing protein [Stenotrophomonas sp.]UQY97924.1 DUF2975 domain-containing protein [Stenotrophomonas maltophilia]